MTTKRLTKRELREDPVMEAVTKVSDWTQQYGKQALIALGIVVAVLLLVVYFRATRRANEAQASEQLLRAEYQMSAGDLTGATAALTDIQKRYGGTPSARRALRDLADARYLAGNLGESEKLYREYLSKVNENSIEGRAGLTGLAACYEQGGQFAKAAETYDKIAGLSGANELGSMALWAEGRCWNNVGQFNRAAQAYDRILTEHPRSRYTNLAREEKAEALARAGR